MTSSTAAPKRSKIVSRGRALEKGHHIYYAVKLFDVQEVLDKFHWQKHTTPPFY